MVIYDIIGYWETSYVSCLWGDSGTGGIEVV